MLATFQSWLAAPFKSDMDALHWFLFIGLICVAFILWHMILKVVEG
jgi:hypothetical protein